MRLFHLDFEVDHFRPFNEYNANKRTLESRVAELAAACDLLGVAYSYKITEYALTVVPKSEDLK